MITAQTILDFWFKELSPPQWWVKDAALDNTISERFASIHQEAVAGELFDWRINAEGALAEVIVLDQFSRNIYRGDPKSFAADPIALILAQTAIANGFDKQLAPEQRGFLYLPFMHSESLKIHDKAVELYTELGSQNQLDFEVKHKVIIERFGRYPHRNEILGRESTAEEIAFLREPNSSF